MKIQKGKVAMGTIASLAMAAALPVLGCQQDQPRSNSMSNATGTPYEKAIDPSVGKVEETSNTANLLIQLHAANQDEIDIGKIAAEKARRADIQKFADDMIADHTAADQKLVDLARRMNINIHAEPVDPLQKALLAATNDEKRSLHEQSGPQFEVSYVAPQVSKHTFALYLVDEGQKTASGELKGLLDEMRPTVKAHLDRAKSLTRSLAFSPAIGGGPVEDDPVTYNPDPSAFGKDGGRYRTSPKTDPTR